MCAPAAQSMIAKLPKARGGRVQQALVRMLVHLLQVLKLLLLVALVTRNLALPEGIVSVQKSCQRFLQWGRL